MSIEQHTAFTGWCAVINIGLLLWWFLFITQAHDWTYQLHRKWFYISNERFDAIHYSGMAIFKISIFLFNITPYLALKIIT